MSATPGTIVERLTAQRTNLLDVVRQIDTAIAAFGGAPNGNGTPTNGKPVHWTQRVSKAKLSRIMRKAARTRHANASQQQQSESVATF